jgi:ribose transport system substrate-binding protein
MKTGKKIVIVMLALTLVAFAFAGCASSATPGVTPSAQPAVASSQAAASPAAASEAPAAAKITKVKKLGLSMYTQKNPYYKAMQNAIEAYCKEKGIEMVATDAQDDINKQISDIEDLLAQGVDAILMNPSDPDSIVEVTKKAVAKGVQVVSLDNMVSDSAPVVTVVLSNNTANGKMVGNWVAKKMGTTPIKAFIISGAKGSVVGEDRRQGLIRGIVEEQLATMGKSQITIVGQIYTDWLADEALKNFQEVAAGIGDFNAVLSEADVMTLACMPAIKDMGLADKVIYGNAADGEKLAFETIKGGAPYATGLNNPGLIGKTGVDVLIGYIEKGTSYGAVTYTPADCVSKDNVDKYYDPNAAF